MKNNPLFNSTSLENKVDKIAHINEAHFISITRTKTFTALVLTWLSTKGADKKAKYSHIVLYINLQTVIAVYWTQTYETPNKFSFLCTDFTV